MLFALALILLLTSTCAQEFNTWISLSLPQFDPRLQRSLHVAALLQDKVFVFGGIQPGALHFDQALDDSFWFDFNSTTIIPIQSPTQPTARAGSAFAANGTDVYVFGGFATGTNLTLLNDTWIFHSESETWEVLDTLGAPFLALSSGLFYNGDFFVLGGLVDTTTGSTAADLWQLNVASRTWSKVIASGLIPAGLASFSAIVADDQLLVTPGCATFGISPADSPFYCLSWSISTLYSFVFATSTWAAAGPVTKPVGQFMAAPTSDPSAFLLLLSSPIASSSVFLLNVTDLTWTETGIVDPLSSPTPSIAATTLIFDATRRQYFILGGAWTETDSVSTEIYRFLDGFWNVISPPASPSPRASLSGSVHGDLIIYFGGSNEQLLDDLWLLNTTSLTWINVAIQSPWPTARSNHASAIIGSTMYLFGGTSSTVSTLNDTWALDLLTLQWSPLSSFGPSNRCGHSMIPISSTQIMLFGGQDNVKNVLGDTWIFDVITFDWLDITPTMSPPARSFYSLEMLGKGRAVMYGGLGQFGSALTDIWAFDTTASTWANLTINYYTARPKGRFQAGTTTLGCNIMVVVGGQSFEDGLLNEILLGYFINNTDWKWNIIATTDFAPCYGLSSSTFGQSDDYCARLSSLPSSPISSNQIGQIVTSSFGVGIGGFVQAINEIQYSLLGCNPGFYLTSNLTQCQPCPIGTYSSTPGASQCEPCIGDTTTTKIGSNSSIQCSLCKSDHCANGGICYVSAETNTIECTCGFFFDSGVDCRGLSNVAIAIIAIACGLAAFTGVFALARHFIRKSRATNRSLIDRLARQQREFDAAWEIPDAHLKRVQMIGTGGYARVWLAFWGDRAVAVKTLLRSHRPLPNVNGAEPLETQPLLRQTSVMQELSRFEEEIRFLRQIKHTNIVFCFGAGVDSDSHPFLVLEYCSRGTLRGILEDELTEWPWSRQLETAVDVANGLSFLHTLSKPAIHGDITSYNVVLSEGWVAKLADFGTLQYEQLLNPEIQGFDFRTNCGRPDWCAPELFEQNNHHSLKTDVYSFGIVMFEIAMRSLPFPDTASGARDGTVIQMVSLLRMLLIDNILTLF